MQFSVPTLSLTVKCEANLDFLELKRSKICKLNEHEIKNIAVDYFPVCNCLFKIICNYMRRHNTSVQKNS